MSLIYCEPYDRCARSTGHRLRLSDSYDYQNRLVWRRMDGNGDGDYEQKRVFVYDGNQVVMDFQRTGAGNIQASNLKWRYLWGPAVDQVLAEEAVDGGTDDLVQWTLTDHLNTVRDIARFDPQTGATTVVNHLVYDAFGKVTAETNPAVDSLFLFTARPFDPDTQLQNNLNRWYDARVGRWLSEDPLGFDGGDSNLYRYVRNAGIIGLDPIGLLRLPILSDLWDDIKERADRRRGHGAWGDSAQHCWAACYIGAVYGVGNLAAIIADWAEYYGPSPDSERDICAQHRGAYFGHQYSWLKIFTLGAKPEMTAEEWCDMSCDTWAG
ncbi:MAG: RHS repeat-associated core domain-containing protein [Thermogutta sp.]